MDSDNYEVIYCADEMNIEYIVKSVIKFVQKDFKKNHLKSGTHTNNFYERQRLNITNI